MRDNEEGLKYLIPLSTLLPWNERESGYKIYMIELERWQKDVLREICGRGDEGNEEDIEESE